MRELNQSEVLAISGGNSKDGYTFSFVALNATCWAIPLAVLGLCSKQNPVQTAVAGALIGTVIGGGYALIRMAASAMDSYTFSE